MADGSDRGCQGATRTELVWPGKRTQVERIALPFQVVETVNQSRATREREPLLSGLPPPPLFEGQLTADTAWKNKLIWGDNKYVMASLLQGDPAIGLEPLAGKIDLIYIDPPFFTGTDQIITLQIGEDIPVTKEASIMEETAYRNVWKDGAASYFQWVYDRLYLMKELLSSRGMIFIRHDQYWSHYVKVIGDDVFGKDNFQNEITVKRIHKNVTQQGRLSVPIATDSLLVYFKSPDSHYHDIHKQLAETRSSYWRALDDSAGIRRPPQRIIFGKVFYPPPGKHFKFSQAHIDALASEGSIRINPRTGRPQYLVAPANTAVLNSNWTDISGYSFTTGYPTENSEELLGRVVRAGSNSGDVVADFFCGSGTTMAVAEKLGRRWVGCDLSRYATQISRKRLLDIPGCQPFEVLNLGKYERRHWQVSVLTGPQDDGSKAVADYLRFIVALYHGEPVGGYAHLHGQRAGRWVHVGATDASVTRDEVMSAVRECQANRYTALDVLGWEWEMGLHDTIRDEARRLGVDLRLLYIPREVMDKRAVAAGDVHFYELAYLKTTILQDARTVTVRLDDFIIPNPDLVPDDVRSKVKKWSDYIDFWAVDWNYAEDTFHNEWQTYRTRKSPVLRLISDPHTYQEPGQYRILVRVIDIFGNDTTQLLEVKA